MPYGRLREGFRLLYAQVAVDTLHYVALPQAVKQYNNNNNNNDLVLPKKPHERQLHYIQTLQSI